MKLKSLAVLILVSSLSFAQVIVSNNLHIQNHGGFGLYVNIGANKGDTIDLDVVCDHDVRGQCFDGVPKLASGTLFNLTSSQFQHQHWKLTVPTTGDQFVSAQYFWVGAEVHYTLKVIARERLKGKNL